MEDAQASCDAILSLTVTRLVDYSSTLLRLIKIALQYNREASDVHIHRITD